MPPRPAALLPRVAGVGLTPLTTAPGASPLSLALQALHAAIADAAAPGAAALPHAPLHAPPHAPLAISDLDGLIALPSLMGDTHFMAAHALAGAAGMFAPGASAARGGRPLLVRTLDVGGAGPVAALLMAARMVAHEGCRSVAVVAADTPGSAPLEAFLARADAACTGGGSSSSGGGGGARGAGGGAPSPVIPWLYDKIAQWQVAQHGVTREQLAMVASLMTLQAARHPLALQRRPRPVAEVLASRQVAPFTTALECAKRVDGGAAVIVVSPEFAAERGLPAARGIAVLGGGEGAGPLAPPDQITQISDDTYASAAQAAAAAYAAAGLEGARDVDYFSIYDCFPVCFIRGLEAVGLAPPGGGGRFVEAAYMAACHGGCGGGGSSGGGGDETLSPLPPDAFPINTNGGLLGLGAPWEAPALYGIAEAVVQLRGEAAGRQVAAARGGPRRALVYGNGGVLSASAVAILGRCEGGGGSGGGAASRL